MALGYIKEDKEKFSTEVDKSKKLYQVIKSLSKYQDKYFEMTTLR